MPSRPAVWMDASDKNSNCSVNVLERRRAGTKVPAV